MNILGIQGGVTPNQHDPSAVLISDGKLVAACEEERFLRVKSPRGILPLHAIRAVLEEGGLTMKDIDVVAHPGETYEDLPARLRYWFDYHFSYMPRLQSVHHQRAHMASAYYCSGFDDAAVISYDNVGDRQSVAWGSGSGHDLSVDGSYGQEKSLGLFYAAMTSFLGFEINEGEYKVMGLAVYGRPGVDLSQILRVAGADYQLDTSYFDRDPPVIAAQEPYFGERLKDLLGRPRSPESEISQYYMDVAYATQAAQEGAIVALVERVCRETARDRLCIAGGVGLNCTANMKLISLPCVTDLFVQPASSDRGLSLGCALDVAAKNGELPGKLHSVALGPSKSVDDIGNALEITGMPYETPGDLIPEVVQLLIDGKIVGWFQGRS